MGGNLYKHDPGFVWYPWLWFDEFFTLLAWGWLSILEEGIWRASGKT